MNFKKKVSSIGETKKYPFDLAPERVRRLEGGGEIRALELSRCVQLPTEVWVTL